MKNLKNTFGRAPDEATQIVEALGGNSALAEAIGVTPQAISYWRRKGIPRPWLMSLRKTHKHIFPAPVKQPKAAKPAPPEPSATTPCARCGHCCTPSPGQHGAQDE